LGTGNPQDVNELWYSVVGFQILSNLFLNAIIPNIAAIGTVLAFGCLNWFMKCCIASTQEELQDMAQGPEYKLQERYS